MRPISSLVRFTATSLVAYFSFSFPHSTNFLSFSPHSFSSRFSGNFAFARSFFHSLSPGTDKFADLLSPRVSTKCGRRSLLLSPLTSRQISLLSGILPKSFSSSFSFSSIPPPRHHRPIHIAFASPHSPHRLRLLSSFLSFLSSSSFFSLPSSSSFSLSPLFSFSDYRFSSLPSSSSIFRASPQHHRFLYKTAYRLYPSEPFGGVYIHLNSSPRARGLSTQASEIFSRKRERERDKKALLSSYFTGGKMAQTNGVSSSSNGVAEISLSPDEKRREEKAFHKLKELGIDFKVYRHGELMTVDAMVNESILKDKGLVLANLFLKDKKKGYFLVSVLHTSSTPMKGVGKLLGASNLRFVDDQLLPSLLDVTKGAVTPLAIMTDAETGKNEISLVLDKKLKENEEVVVLVHPLHNKATVSLKVSDLIKFVEACKHSITWIDCDEAVKLADACKGENASTPGGQQPRNGSKQLQQGKAKNAKDTSEGCQKEGTGGATDSSMLGVTVTKSENFPEWYTQVIVRSEMIEYYDISGCYIMRPWAYHIWEKVQRFFDEEIKKMGVENSYFPMFVSKHKLEKEKDHVEGFSPEVAWVTHYGDSPLAEKIAIRPTSETIMYPAYSKWIRSHRDLPLKLNQWCSVVRWEFKQPTPFLRTREFLWQEGHTAHATEEEAWALVLDILDLYARWYEECLAVPVIKGVKSENEKFAGGKKTTTVEAFIPDNGRGIQAATSHLLGTNFAKMFDIEFEDEGGEKKLCHQTSWGCTTRSIGVMVMTHGDDKGLVLPPRVASVQVVIIPIYFKDEKIKEINAKCVELKATLESVNVRVRIDDRSNYTPGWKYNHWEVKGVPLRLELGPKDLAKQSARIVRRDKKSDEEGASLDIPWNDLSTAIPQLLETVQKNLFDKAKEKLDQGIEKVMTFEEVLPALNRKHLVLAPWCEDPQSEEDIKKETQRLSEIQAAQSSDAGGEQQQIMTGAMKTLCIPFDQPPLPAGTKCFYTGKPATKWTLWGRSY